MSTLNKSNKVKQETKKINHPGEMIKSHSEIQIPQQIQFYSYQKSSFLYSILLSKTPEGTQKIVRTNTSSTRAKVIQNGVLAISQLNSQVYLGFIKMDKIDQNLVKQKLQKGIFENKWQLNTEKVEIQFKQNQIILINDKIVISNKDLYSKWKSILNIFVENNYLTTKISYVLNKFINKQSFLKLLQQWALKSNLSKQKQQNKTVQASQKDLKQQLVNNKKKQFSKEEIFNILLSQPQKKNIQSIIQKIQQYDYNLNKINLQNKRLNEELQNYKSFKEPKAEKQQQCKSSDKSQQQLVQNQSLFLKQQYKEISIDSSLIKDYYKDNQNSENQMKQQFQKITKKLQNMHTYNQQRYDKLLNCDHFDNRFQQIIRLVSQKQKKEDYQQSQNFYLKSQVKNTEQKLKEKDNLIQMRQKELEQLRILSNKIDQRTNQEQMKIKASQEQISYLNLNIQRLKSQITIFLTSLNDKEKQIVNLKSANTNLLLQSNQIKKTINQQNQNQKSEILQRQQKINQLQSELKQAKAQTQKISLLIQEIHHAKSLMQNKESEMFYHIFQGVVLHACQQQKKYLKKQIETYIEKDILYTSLLYRYDPLNPTNYHKYFDQQENICVLIKLANGKLIAGFSVSAVSTNVLASKGGIICSLTEKKSFKLIEGKRSVTYDTYFFIFGNSQLRLKHNDNKFFTNFGISNSFYDSKGQKYTVLNGTGSQREQVLQTYQIFKVIFK